MLTLDVIEGEIEMLAVDAVVAAVDQNLNPADEQAAAIFAAAGESLAAACRRNAPCPPGEVRVTPGFNLAAWRIIHAAPPEWDGNVTATEARLISTFEAIVAAASRHECRSLAVPLLGVGPSGLPRELTARTLMRCTLKTAADYAGLFRQVLFVAPSAENARALHAARGDVFGRLA